MVEKWCESFETHSGGVPSMTMLWMLNLAARENGIRSDMIGFVISPGCRSLGGILQ